MMQNDLISRSALLKDLMDKGWLKGDLTDGTVMIAVQAIIDTAPAVDAVAFVKCTECQFQNTCKRIIEIYPKQKGRGSLEGHLHGCEYGVRRKDHAK